MKLKILFLLLFFPLTGFAQTQISADSGNSAEIKVNALKLSAIGGISTAALIYGYAIKDNFLFSGEKSGFHFNTAKDKEFLFYSDKYRHLFISNLMSSTYADLFQWAGVKKERSLLYGGIVTFSYLTFVEIRDGFSRDSYFSLGDLAADLVGSSYPYLSEKIPLLKSFQFKISYPAARIKYLDQTNIEANGWEITNNWLSIDVHSLLPKSAQKYYPSFVNVAIGTNTNIYGPSDGGYQEVYLSLDWNIESIPGDGWFWIQLKKLLNFYHFPAPAVRIHPTAVWYGLKF